MFVSYRPVSIGPTCNFNCEICGCKDTSSGHCGSDDLTLLLNSIPESENIEFIGGELFIRKDMESIITLSKKRFGRVKYNTNGAVFASKGYLARAVSNGMNNVCQKFFSTNPETHAAITKTDSLKYVTAGFENLADHYAKANISIMDGWECGFFLSVNLFAHSMTLPTLESSAKYISEKRIPRLIIDFSYSDCASDEALLTVRRCLEMSVRNGTWAVVKGLPVCAMRGFEEHCGDVFRTERFIPGNVFIPGVCDCCVLYSTCGGAAAAIAGKRRWSPITTGTHLNNMDDIVFFHSHIPAGVPSIPREGEA